MGFDSLERAPRTTFLSILFALTLISCAVQMARIYLSTKQVLSYQMAVIMLAFLEASLGVLHWSFVRSTVCNFLMIFLKECQLIIITYFFILSALVAFDKRYLERR